MDATGRIPGSWQYRGVRVSRMCRGNAPDFGTGIEMINTDSYTGGRNVTI